jgi:trigger factor
MKDEIHVDVTIEKKPGSLVVITGELPYSALEKHRSTAVQALGKDLAIDGFRKGHVPEQILIRTIGEMALITEMAEYALKEYYPHVVKEHTLDIIGYPQIGITKIAKDNPLGFTITVAVVPDITLPDYFGIAKELNTKKESKEVTDDEVTKQVNDILRQKVAYERLQEKAQQKERHVHSDTCDHDHDETESPDTPIEDVKDIPLPELTDEYVKTFGKEGQFTGVEDFRTKIREHLTLEKSQEVDSRHRAKITDAIIEKTTIDVPKVLIDAEIGQMFAQMESDLTRAQLKIDDYLAHVKKTREDLIQEWTPNATTRATLQLVLNAIAEKEHILPDAEALELEVSHLMEQYKDADEKRVRVYIASVLTNEAVMKKLEEVT